MSLKLYIAASLDGFIADKEGSVAWLDDFQDVNYGYSEFLAGIETIIMGRNTYDQALSFGPWPYVGKATIVLTRRQSEDQAPQGVVFYKGDVRALVQKIKSRAKNSNIWLVGGARTNAQFFAYDLIDEIQLAIMPIVLGQGLPLVTPVDVNRRFELLQAQPFSNGVVMMHYSRTAMEDEAL